MTAEPGVLHVIPDLQTGGAERLVVELAAATARAGGRALISSRGGAMVAEAEARGARHITLNTGSKNPLTIARNALRLKQLVQDHEVGIVHIHSRAPAWSGVWARSLGMSARLVTTHHGTYGARSALKRFYNSGIVRGDAVIAHSEFIAELIRSRHPFAARELHVIPAGIDTSTFDPTVVPRERALARRADWGIGDGQRIVIHPARLTAWKGQAVLIEALAILNRPDVTVILAGDAQGRTDYLAELDSLIAARGLTGRVIRVGAEPDMPTAYAASDIAVFPSTQAEAFGLAVVEAQAMGLPVVVSDHGAPVETVLTAPNNRTGWRVMPSDPAALADGIKQALALSADDRRAMSQRSRQHVVTHYSLRAMTEAHLQLYRGLAGSP